MGKKSTSGRSPKKKSAKLASRSAPKAKSTAASPPPTRITETSEQLAKLFSCTTRQIELLAKKGIIVRVGHGRYDPIASTTNYVVHLREQAAARVGQDPNADAVAASAGYRHEQREWLRDRRMAFRGEYVKAADVRERWGGLMRGVRQGVLGLKTAFAQMMPGATAADIKRVDQMLRDTLEDMALGTGFSVAPSVPDEDAPPPTD